MMINMEQNIRTTVTLDKDVYRELVKMRGEDDRYLRMSISAMISEMVKKGLSLEKRQGQ